MNEIIEIDKKKNFWKNQSIIYKDNDKFKNSVIKDQEIIAFIGALIMTIVFSYENIQIKNIIGYIYIISLNICICFSSLTTITSIRTIVLVNSLPCEKTEELMDRIEIHKSKYYLAWLHPFNLMQLTIFTLFTSHSLLIYLKYGIIELIIIIPIIIITLIYAMYDNIISYKTRFKIAEHILLNLE
jgi:hypothetical protein|tara:strand:- start:4056 stop:4610 length:555 start_codon:yes stop_codon:yes gene_type:complete